VFLIQAVILNDCRIRALRELADKRNAALEELLRFRKFVFELDAQQQWIKEHLPLAVSEKLGQNLHQAQSLHKKHHKLEAEIIGHQPMIDRTLASGQALAGQAHPKIKQVWTNTIQYNTIQYNTISCSHEEGGLSCWTLC